MNCDRNLARSSQLQSELRLALENEALDLVYQPVFELPHQRLIKIEALLRLRRSDGSHLAPAAFIPQAESSGLIHRLGHWVLTTACRQGAAWLAGGSALKVAVNVSPVQLRALDFPRAVKSILEKTALPPHLLELEVTESVF